MSCILSKYKIVEISNLNSNLNSNSNSNSTDKCCYLCLEQINYYYQFECGCYNYIHSKCIEDKKIHKCLICKKKINLSSNNNYDIFDLYYSYLFLEIINKIFNYFITVFEFCPNIFTLGLLIMLNIFCTFVFIIPVILLNIIFNFIKKYLFELIDLYLLFLFFVFVIHYYLIFMRNTYV